MVSQPGEEDSAAQQRDLQRADVDVDSVFVPCPRADGIRDGRCDDPVEVEQEEDGEPRAEKEEDEKVTVAGDLLAQTLEQWEGSMGGGRNMLKPGCRRARSAMSTSEGPVEDMMAVWTSLQGPSQSASACVSLTSTCAIGACRHCRIIGAL